MKVKIRTFSTKENYKANVNPTSEVNCESVTKALSICKKEVMHNRNSSKFVGFKIESLKGEKLHKLHNNF